MYQIFKSGSKYEPFDNKGIAIISCIGKLFNSILNNRFESYLTNFNVISESQIGSQKKSRTVDHMLILKILIEKCIVYNIIKNIYDNIFYK